MHKIKCVMQRANFGVFGDSVVQDQTRYKWQFDIVSTRYDWNTTLKNFNDYKLRGFHKIV